MRAEMRADWLEVSAAVQRVLSAVKPLETVRLPLTEALGYVLAERVTSPIDLPAHDNSAMDGFAVRAADILGASSDDPRELPVAADVPAGAAVPAGLEAGHAVRVMTGAPVPPGADSVVRVEHTDGGVIDGAGRGAVRIRSDADAHRNIRPRGEDLRIGDVVLEPGRVLRPAEIAVAASVGRKELAVVRRPVVGVLTSGDELVDVDGFDEVLAGRRIVSTNTYSLAAQLREIGVEARDLGIAPDTTGGLLDRLQHARGCDALITSAGISMGEHDLVRSVLSEIGTEFDFWRVKMRPGSPVAFGRVGGLGGIPWFGLPGNPVSSMVTFEVLVRPAILKMCGRSEVFAPTVEARLEEDQPLAPGLTHFLRVHLGEADTGLTARAAGPQGSGILTSMVRADALLVVPGGGGRRGDGFRAIVLGGAPLRPRPGY